MNTGIHIETKIDGSAVEAATQAVERIFKAGFDNHMDQETVVEALHTMRGVLVPPQMNLTGCNITMAEDPRQPGLDVRDFGGTPNAGEGE